MSLLTACSSTAANHVSGDFARFLYLQQPQTQRLMGKRGSKMPVLLKVRLDLRTLLKAAPDAFAAEHQALLQQITRVIDTALGDLEQGHLKQVMSLSVSIFEMCNSFGAISGSLPLVSGHVIFRISRQSFGCNLQPKIELSTITYCRKIPAS